MIFKHLFHGHDTNVEENNQTTIYHNRSFPEDENYNFIILNEQVEDFDLFNLIQSEQEQTKAPLRFISTHFDNKALFISLNFEVETYSIFEARKYKQRKGHPTIQIEEAKDLSAYQAYRDSYTDKKIEEKLFKAKKNHIIVAKLDDKIVGSMLLHERKDFIEIDDLFVLENYRSQKIGTSLLNYASEQDQSLRLISDQTHDYLKKDFKKIESLIVATRY